VRRRGLALASQLPAARGIWRSLGLLALHSREVVARIERFAPRSPLRRPRVARCPSVSARHPRIPLACGYVWGEKGKRARLKQQAGASMTAGEKGPGSIPDKLRGNGPSSIPANAKDAAIESTIGSANDHGTVPPRNMKRLFHRNDHGTVPLRNMKRLFQRKAPLPLSRSTRSECAGPSPAVPVRRAPPGP